ncbi:uncharacterized protein LOC117242041 [Bombus vosnesenskii]|uniref:Uncharacterized protein LOC117242041 n=1 Tax=Bombus vosnesenskii TaxID=207650 RepID=A0A6J3LFW7_9HYME|nr:uncharacterized protein LOC117242041 [Bombus vosnesenskii]
MIKSFRDKIECENTVALVKRECEDILEMSRETAEKQFHEVVELYNEAKEKVTRLEKRVEMYEGFGREQENRGFELANLLETLKRFDVDVGSVCQLTAEALKNLTERGNLFEESMKNLRHLAWIVKDRKDEPQLVLLREQNSVLRQVVKNLKRKFQMLSQAHDIPEKENEERHESLESEINSRNHNGNLSNAPVLKENTKENSINSSIHENHNSCNAMKHNERGETVTREITDAYKNDNRNKQFDIERTIIDKRGRLLCIESHSNGVVYEEYVFKLSIDREMKIKYPVSLNNSEEVVRLEFVDNETDYSVTSMDRMLILLKNIHAIVIVKQTGVSCSTQTTKTKTSNNFAQTAITGVNSFSRLNSGATVSKEISTFSTLNCTFRHWIYLLRTNITLEKRAIERSLYNLERIVKTLKLNALNQVETMIDKDSHLLGNNEILNYMKALTQ